MNPTKGSKMCIKYHIQFIAPSWRFKAKQMQNKNKAKQSIPNPSGYLTLSMFAGILHDRLGWQGYLTPFLLWRYQVSTI